MIIANEIYSQYTNHIKLIKLVGKNVTETLVNYCEKHTYPFVSRYKSIESVSEKIESGRFHSWSEINDIYACTIIIPNLNEEASVIKDINIFFNVIETIGRGTYQKAPEVFRFDSTRIIAKLFDYTGSKPISKYPFEIQIKSAFEYAWAITTHSLTYKTNKPDWKRYRLAAQLKASVEQLDTLVLGFEDVANKIPASYHKPCEEKRELTDIIEKYFKVGLLPGEFHPKDMSRNCENMLNLLYACKWYKKSGHKEKLNYIMQFFEYSLNQLDHLPRSVSLFQLFYCCLAEGNYINKVANTYYPIVTEEMETLFPSAKNYNNKFEIIAVA